MAFKRIWWELWFSWCKQCRSSLHDQITACFEHFFGITDIVMVSALESLVPFLKFKAQGLTLQLPKVVSWIARSDNDVRGLKKIAAGLTTTCECGCCYMFFVGNALELHKRLYLLDALDCQTLISPRFSFRFHVTYHMTCTNLFTQHRLLYPNSCAAETQTRFVSERSHCNCSGKLLTHPHRATYIFTYIFMPGGKKK